jgi:hypothetical protein
MLGDGGKGNGKGRGELGNGGWALRQASQDGAAGGIGKSAEGGVERGAGGGRTIVNHMVYYCEVPAGCQWAIFLPEKFGKDDCRSTPSTHLADRESGVNVWCERQPRNAGKR